MCEETTPVVEYEAEKTKQAALRKAEDMKMWQQWKKKPTARNLQPLIDRFEPTFRLKARQWKSREVQEAALRSNMKRHAIKAFGDYDPKHPKAASLHTFVTSRLRKSMRFAQQRRNLADIPEEKAYAIGHIDRAKDQLQDQLGQAPTNAQIATHLRAQPGMSKLVRGITPQQVTEIQKSRVRDIPASAFESDPIKIAPTRQAEVTSLLRPTLKPDEQKVYDLLFPRSGRATKSTKRIAQRLGISEQRVSRMKTRMLEEHKKWR